jgi:hypothetical protein
LYCSTSVSDLTTAQVNANNYMEIRAQLCGQGFQLQNSRVSMDDVSGDSLLAEPPIFPASRVYNQDFVLSPGQADVSWNTLLVRMASGSLYRKSMYLSGIPDSVTMAGNIPVRESDTLYTASNVTAFNKAYRAWQLEIIGGNWAIKSISKDPTTAPVKAVTSFNGLASLVNCPGHGFAINDSIRISGCKTITAGAGKLNGIWSVASVPTSDTFTIKGWDETLLFNMNNTGKAQKRVYVLNNINSTNTVRLANHKRGGRSGLPLGRARTKKH